MTNELGWYFERRGQYGGAGGSAFTGIFEGKAPADSLAREVIQNAVDARRPDARVVRVEFRFVRLSGIDARAFKARLGAVKLQGRGMTHPFIDDPAGDVRLLYIDDFGTTGLVGDPTGDESSNFAKLFCDLGETEKIAGHGTGGSFGYGKAALLMNSSARLVVAFTRVVPVDGVTYRAMGFAYFRKHKLNGQTYTGRGFFGVRSTSGQDEVQALLNERAQRFAHDLGFTSRGADDGLGTSLLLVEPCIDHDRLLHAVETWWWPALEDGLLDVTVTMESGEVLRPEHRRRSYLKPFLEGYALARGTSEAQPPDSQRFEIRWTGKRGRQSSGARLGVVGLVRGAVETEDVDEETDVSPERAPDFGRVALVREPRMVVAYRGYRGPETGVCGTFVADQAFDDILRLSEPPSHDEWAPDSERLEGVSFPAGQSTLASEAVRFLHGKLRSHVIAMGKNVIPPPPGAHGIPELERLLGSLFRPKNKVAPPVPPKQGDFHVEESTPRPKMRRDSRLLYRAEPIVRLPDVAEKSVRAQVLFRAWIAVGDSRAVQKEDDDKVEINVHYNGSDYQAKGEVVVPVELHPGREARFRVDIGPINDLYEIGLATEVSSL